MVIDVSYNQGTINWAKVKPKIDAVIIQLGYGMDDRGQDDKQFKRNLNECITRGIPWGVYLYSYADSALRAESEAEHVLHWIRGKSLNFPVFLDIEEHSCGKYGKVVYAAFSQIIKAAGFRCGLYAGESFYNDYLAGIDADYRWIAKYGKNDGKMHDKPFLDDGASVDMWQYTSKGYMDGIKGNVDCNILQNVKMWYVPQAKTATSPVKSEQTNIKSEPEVFDVEIREKATKWMEDHAKDDSHGYDQKYRWGEKGDYDCSSAVISAWQAAGVPVKDKGATYTGNMKKVFLSCGFKDVTKSVNLKTGKGLLRGDVLLNTVHHVAMYCGSGKEVEASINEKGKAVGGKPGDQTGKEFLVRSYRNYPWDCVLQYGEGEVVDMPTVEYKDTGTAVYIWQCILCAEGYQIDRDGEFGKATQEATKKLQAKIGMSAKEQDGAAGPKTYEAYRKYKK